MLRLVRWNINSKMFAEKTLPELNPARKKVNSLV